MGVKQLSVASAIHDHDVLAHGKPKGNYLQRVATLLRDTVKPWPPNRNFVHNGMIKRACFSTGVRFVHKDALTGGQPMRKLSMQLHASRCFYNLAFQEMMINHCQYKPTRDNIKVFMTRHGYELVSMVPQHPNWWMGLVEDMMSSDVVQKMDQSFIDNLTSTNEMAHAQFDATVKIVMNIQCQGSYRTSKKKKQEQALPEDQAVYRVACVKGTTGAVRIVAPVRDESADTVARLLVEELSQEEIASIKTFSVDHATHSMEASLDKLCPNFEALIQDSKHLEIRYRGAQWGKSSPGSILLGSILSKFNRYSESNGIHTPYFKTNRRLTKTKAEKKHLRYILNAKMPVEEALSFIEKLDFNAPFVNRLTFVKAVAALVALYPEETAKVGPPGPLTTREVLYNGCQPESVEFKLNHTRLLHRVDARVRGFIANGTCSIEALNRELNQDWFHNTSNVYQSTLRLKTKTFRFAKLWSHNKMMTAITNRSYEQKDVLTRSVAVFEAWDEQSWACHCDTPLDLPLMRLKKAHMLAKRIHTRKLRQGNSTTKVLVRKGKRSNIVLKWDLKKPKLTPFNIPRRQALVQTRGSR